MRYGYFDNENREYVITNPKTPVKWINYIGELSFGGFVDQTGGSLICKGDPALNRIVKYLPQLPDYEFNGETLYARIKTADGWRIFSPYFVPTLDTYDSYECRIGLGYTVIMSEFYGIRTEALIFVPLSSNRVIRDIRVTNISEKAMEIDLIPVVEYSHFDALKQFTNADWVPQTMQSKIVDVEGIPVLMQYAFMNRDARVNYFTSNHPVSSFESERSRFLGDNEYGTWAKPLSLFQDELECNEAHRGDNIAALMHHLGKLESGETVRIITQLGQCKQVFEDVASIHFYRNPANVDKAFLELKKFWNDYLSRLQVMTPDKSMNTMLNIYNPRQCSITKNWSRDLSLYQLGFGGRGIGFRDSSQDVMGIISNSPEEAREQIERLLSMQKSDGSAMHQYNPYNMEGSCGDAAEREDRPDYYGDDHLWIVLTVCEYVKETGNFEFLGKQIPFYDKDKNGNALGQASVLEHLDRAVGFTKLNVGAHGIPLLGYADWNDCVNLPTGAESFFNADLYGKALLELSTLMGYLHCEEQLRYRDWYEEMKERVNRHGWDGEWYLRYFDDNGQPLGSKVNDHGKIYVNAQSWSVISGFASEDRGRAALESVNRLLYTKNGIKLSYPGFNGYDREKGGITTYPPGAKENGGIFLHCNPWVMIAETMLGNGNRAYEYYSMLNPVNKNEKIEEYECEPYCYPQNILGDEHPRFGLARNSWLSGTAAWMYQAAVKHILGIRPTYEGLVIDPCIPDFWDGYRASRQFRGATYEINVQNRNHICTGIDRIVVDDVEYHSNVIPSFGDNSTHKVEVWMK